MIRTLKKSDISSIEILMKSTPGFWNENWRSDVIKRGMDASNGLSFVWEEKNKIVGFICAHDLGFRAYLSELIVAEEARGKNIGKQLLEIVEKELLLRNCELIISDVWKDAVKFYNNLGWSSPDVVLLRKNIKENC